MLKTKRSGRIATNDIGLICLILSKRMVFALLKKLFGKSEETKCTGTADQLIVASAILVYKVALTKLYVDV